MNFPKTVDRLQELKKLRGAMRDNTGEDIKEDMLAEAFLPPMDAACQSDIVELRIKTGTG